MPGLCFVLSVLVLFLIAVLLLAGGHVERCFFLGFYVSIFHAFLFCSPLNYHRFLKGHDTLDSKIAEVCHFDSPYSPLLVVFYAYLLTRLVAHFYGEKSLLWQFYGALAAFPTIGFVGLLIRGIIHARDAV